MPRNPRKMPRPKQKNRNITITFHKQPKMRYINRVSLKRKMKEDKSIQYHNGKLTKVKINS